MFKWFIKRKIKQAAKELTKSLWNTIKSVRLWSQKIGDERYYGIKFKKEF